MKSPFTNPIISSSLNVQEPSDKKPTYSSPSLTNMGQLMPYLSYPALAKSNQPSLNQLASFLTKVATLSLQFSSNLFSLPLSSQYSFPQSIRTPPVLHIPSQLSSKKEDSRMLQLLLRLPRSIISLRSLMDLQFQKQLLHNHLQKLESGITQPLPERMQPMYSL